METLTTTIPLHRDALLGLAATLTALANETPRTEVALVGGSLQPLKDWATAKAEPPAPPSPDQTVLVATPEGEARQTNSDALCAIRPQGGISANDHTPEPPEALKETDKTGRVWDERIDSSNHKFTADGLWMRRRNVPQETYDAVVAELMACTRSEEATADFDNHMNAMQDSAAESTPPPPAAPPPPPPAEQPVAAPPPPAPAPTSELTFGTLVEKIQQAGLNNALVTATCMEFELSGLSQVMSRPELIQPIHDKLFPPAS